MPRATRARGLRGTRVRVARPSRCCTRCTGKDSRARGGDDRAPGVEETSTISLTRLDAVRTMDDARAEIACLMDREVTDDASTSGFQRASARPYAHSRSALRDHLERIAARSLTRRLVDELDFDRSGHHLRWRASRRRVRAGNKSVRRVVWSRVIALDANLHAAARASGGVRLARRAAGRRSPWTTARPPSPPRSCPECRLAQLPVATRIDAPAMRPLEGY